MALVGFSDNSIHIVSTLTRGRERSGERIEGMSGRSDESEWKLWQSTCVMQCETQTLLFSMDMHCIRLSNERDDTQKELQLDEGTNHMPSHQNVVSDTEYRFIVASGTAFGEILIWSFDVNPMHRTGCIIPATYTKSGHSGAILRYVGCICFLSSECFRASYRLRWSRDGRSLASVSEDRTVALWDVFPDILTGIYLQAEVKHLGAFISFSYFS